MNVYRTRYRLPLALISFLAALVLVPAVRAQQGESPDTTLQRAIQKELVDGDLNAAIDLYKKAIDAPGSSEAVKAQAWLNLGRCYERLVDANARSAYERVVRQYGNQTAVASEAQRRLRALESRSTRPRLFSNLTHITDIGSVTTGSVSADGRYVFLSGFMGVFDVVTHEIGTLHWNSAPVTRPDLSTAAVLPHAAFSSDGRQIVFAVRSPPGTTPEMRIASLPAAIRESDLGPGRTVFRQEDVVGIAPFGWTGDGNQVLAMLTHKDGNGEIVSIDVTNASPRVVKSLGRRIPNRLAMSPDGRYVAYDAPSEPAGTNRDVFLLSVESGVETPIAEGAALPVWTPDGDAVVFFSDRGGRAGLWMREIAAGTPSGSVRLMRQYDTRPRPIGFSRDGTLYYGTLGDKTVGGLSIDPRFLQNFDGLQIFLANMDASGARVQGPAVGVTSSLVSQPETPKWLAGTGALAFTRRRPRDDDGSRTDLVVRALTSSSDRIYSGLNSGGAWFHSGNAKLIGRNPGSSGGKSWPASINRLDLISGRTEAEFLKPISPFAAGHIGLTEDDKTAYIVGEGPARGNVHVIDIESRQEVRRFSVPRETRGRAFNIENVSLSPDGRSLAMWTNAGLYRITVDGTGWKELYAADPPDWTTSPVWTRDGRGILIAVRDEKRYWRLLRVPADGGAPVFTGLADTLPKDYWMEFDLSPDGTRLAFVAVAPTISTNPR